MQRLCAILAILVPAALAAADTHSWTGALDGDFNSNGNWSPAAVPDDGDSVIIDSGSQDITATLDQSAKDFVTFVIGPNYTGTVGNSSSDELHFGAALCVIAGGGANQYIATGGVHDWEVCIVASVGPNGTDDLYIDGDILALVVHKGDVHLKSGTVTAVYLDATAENNNNVDLTVTTAAITTLYGRHGDCEIDAGTVTTTNWDNGTLQVDGGTFTTISQRGGTVNWDTTTTLTTLNLYDGTFDASGDINAKTITNATMFTGATINLDNSMANIVLTNGVITYGGAIGVPGGAEVNY